MEDRAQPPAAEDNAKLAKLLQKLLPAPQVRAVQRRVSRRLRKQLVRRAEHAEPLTFGRARRHGGMSKWSVRARSG